ncbi:unnamed protein product [Enterobius vermicularis]|uniref:DHX32 n=1 Tax=Enterobius vermicularis TaxID=51028 RepID=A0A0N4UZA1_ENTVE|nr:unnamed protein product [Enterobius vermicularis]
MANILQQFEANTNEDESQQEDLNLFTASLLWSEKEAQLATLESKAGDSLEDLFRPQETTIQSYDENYEDILRQTYESPDSSLIEQLSDKTDEADEGEVVVECEDSKKPLGNEQNLEAAIEQRIIFCTLQYLFIHFTSSDFVSSCKVTNTDFKRSKLTAVD